jgi:nicotinamide riboside transporter PnuC
VAVVLNIPAFFVTGLVGSVLGLLFGSYGAVASAFIAAGSVWFQWRWIGKWVDRHLLGVPANSVEAPAFPSWLVVIIAGIVAIVGVGLALESLYVSFIGWGIALWAIVVGLAVLLAQRRRAHKVREQRPEI